MVFFTCGHCGDSVKKPSVAKHYQWKCRGAPIFVSCMDCNKDFHGEEYAAHTSCITEAEKYSGKDYVQKSSRNSGQKKQESWIEIVRSILTTKEYNTSPAVRGIFQKLQIYENVPRKKAKFQNFVTNCMRVRMDQAEAVWNVLEKALERFKASRPTAATQVKEATTPTESDDLKEGSEGNAITASTENGTTDMENKLAKRKRKRDANVDVEANITDKRSKTAIAGIVSSSDDTKKKKRVESENVQEETTEAEATVVVEKIRKKKRSKLAATEMPDSTITGDPNSKSEEEGEHQQNAITSKKKSKARGPLKPQGTTPIPDDVTSTNHFDWTAHIFRILAKNNDEIHLDRLKKKIFRRYKSAHQVDDIPYKVEKTFNKKLRKSGLSVQDDIVRI